MSKTSYAHPEVLVDTQWVEEHLKDSKVRIAEVDYDPKANYQLGHVAGAVLYDKNIRIFLNEVKQALDARDKIKMVDVRSPKEFTGEILAPPEYPTEHAQRGGHIPGAE